MNPRPRVTAVIIFLNEEKFLRESIESVFAQTFEEWELILVDDGSTDTSTGIALQYAEQYPSRVSYIEHAGHQNRGMSASRNVGVRSARGDYVAFVDGDDIWLPHKLEHEVHILDTHPKAAMVYGPVEYWFSWTQDPEDSERDRVQNLAVPQDRQFGPPELLIKCFPFGAAPDPTMCSFLIRRKVVEEVGWFEEAFRGFYEDLAFLFKVLLKKTVWVSGKCVARYRMHPDSYIHRAVNAGNFRLAMLKLLDFLQGHFWREEVQNPVIWEGLRKARWPHEHPRLQRLAEVSRQLSKETQNLPDGFRRVVSRLKSVTLGNSRGSIQAQPNPIPLSDRYIHPFRIGATTVAWESQGTDQLEVRVGAPDGPVFRRSGPKGRAKTGTWVHDGMVFFLQDVSASKPLIARNTLDTVKVRVRTPDQIEGRIGFKSARRLLLGHRDRKSSIKG